jgi:hypothetical protein
MAVTLSNTVNPINESEGLNDPSIQVGTITDSDTTVTPADLTVTVNFGDGTPLLTVPVSQITQTGPGTFKVTASHTFPEESGSTVPPFADTVTMTVQDTKNAVTSSATGQAFVLDAPLTPGDPIDIGAAQNTAQQFSGVGTTASTTAETAFQTAVGGGVNTAPAPQNGGSRKITWDGVKVDGTDAGGGPNSTTVITQGHTVGIPLNRFQGQGVFFGAVYAVSNDGFADVNPNVANLFPAFSKPNTFAMFNDNGIDFKFVAPSATNTTVVSAASRGFGAIFINVTQPNTTSIQFFHGSTLLSTVFAPVGAAGQPEFVGELFNNPIVTNVLLTLGNNVIFKFDGTTVTPGGTDGGGNNLVATDDWVYAEPVPIANGFPIVSGPQGTTNAPATVSATAGVPVQNAVVATFSDADPNANARDYTATINWGDGHSTNGVIQADGNGGFNVLGSNTYGRAGSFPINVDIADFGGGPGAGGSNPTLSVNNTATVAQGTATVALSATAPTVTIGQPVTFTATVNGPQGTTSPTGSVTFFDGSTPLGTAALGSNGQAALSVPGLGLGSHAITAVYNGDVNFKESTSAALTETVNQRTTTVTLTASSTSTKFSQPVLLTAVVAPSQATGVVDFVDTTTNTIIAFAPLIGGRAVAATPTNLAIGTHTIIAIYSGDTNDKFSVSSPVALVVSPDVTSLISIRPGKIQRVGKLFQQKITLTNLSISIPGPVELVLDGLSQGVTLSNAAGATHVNPPLNSPFVLAVPQGSQFGSGQSLVVTLVFQSRSNAIAYIPRVLAGTNQI